MAICYFINNEIKNWRYVIALYGLFFVISTIVSLLSHNGRFTCGLQGIPVVCESLST